MTYTQVFGGSTLQPSRFSYSEIALSSTITLRWPVNAVSTDSPLTDIIDVTPSLAGQSILLPDATGGSKGVSVLFNNLGANSFSVCDAGGNLVATVGAGERHVVYLASNATTNGTWRTYQAGAGSSGANAATLAGAGLVASGIQLLSNFPVTTTSTSPVTTTDSDRARLINWTGGEGTINLHAAATSFFCAIRNSGTGVLTINPNGSETIDGDTTIPLLPGEGCYVIRISSAAWVTVGRARTQAARRIACVSRITSNVSLTDAVATAITFNNEIYDQGSMFAGPSNDRISVPSGATVVKLSALVAVLLPNAQSPYDVTVEIRTNSGAVVANAWRFNIVTTSATHQETLEIPPILAVVGATTYYRVYVTVNGNGGGGSYLAGSYFMVEEVA